MKVFKKQTFAKLIYSMVCKSHLDRLFIVYFDYPKMKKRISVKFDRLNIRYEFKL